MKISARNVFNGKVEKIVPGAINSEVDIVLNSKDKIVAVVTNTSAQNLKLAAGKDVIALIKASSVLVMTDSSGVTLSARNILSGKIGSVSNGQVNSEVAIKLAGGATVHANITHEAVNELGIKEGVAASAVFKASAVILGVPA
jgi:molybdate transport system regulatory protein